MTYDRPPAGRRPAPRRAVAAALTLLASLAGPVPGAAQERSRTPTPTPAPMPSPLLGYQTTRVMTAGDTAERRAVALTLQPDGMPVGCPTELRGGAIGLQEAVTLALCNDPRTRQSWAAVRAQAAQEQLERAAYWPVVRVNAGAGRAQESVQDSTGRTRGQGQVFNAGLDLAWLLYDFGQRSAAVEAAQLALLAAGASHDRAVQDVYLTAVKAHLGLVEAKGQLELLRVAERFTEDLLTQSTRPRGSSEAISRLGRLQAQTAKARFTLERRQAEGQVAQARGEFAVRLGYAPNLPVDAVLAEGLGEGLGLESAFNTSLDALLEQAQRDHPELRAARARLGAAGAQLDAARRSDSPTVTAVLTQQRRRDGYAVITSERSLGLELSVPLFSGFARKHREHQARATLDGARAEVRSVEQQTALEVWSAYQELSAHRVTFQEADNFLGLANELLAAELQAFKDGDSDMFDVLDAQNSVSEAARARLGSLAGARYQRLRLAASLGRLHNQSRAGQRNGTG